MLEQSADKTTAVATASRRRFSIHVAWTLAARVLMTINSVAAGIIVARWLGAEGLGQLAVINVAVSTIVQLSSAGLPSANTYFIAQDRQRLASVWANALLFGLAAGFLLAAMVAALDAARPSLFGSVPLQLILIAALSIPFQLVTLLGLNVLLGIGRIAQFNLLDALAQSFVLINAVLVLLLLKAGLHTLVSFNTAASILVCAGIVWVIGHAIHEREDKRAFKADAGLFKSMARYGLKFHISIVAAFLIIRADLLIVNHYRGSSESGVYAVASQIASFLLMLPSVVATLIFPRITSEQATSAEFTMRVTRHMSLIMLAVCLVAAPLGFALPLVYGKAFVDVPIQLLILLPGVFLLGLESVLVQYFNSRGVPRLIPAFWVLMFVINVLLNIVFVPRFGARAAAASSTLCYTLVFVFITIYFLRQTGNRFAQAFMLGKGELRELLRVYRISTRA